MISIGSVKFGSRKGKTNQGIEGNKSIANRNCEASVESWSSYGSASSARSTSSSLATASSLVSFESRMPSTAQPQITARADPTSLPVPCQLNCQCEECTKPNADFLDVLLQLSPANLAISTTASPDSLASLFNDMDDFSLDN